MANENAQNGKAAEIMQVLDADWERRKARVLNSLAGTPLDKWLKRRG